MNYSPTVLIALVGIIPLGMLLVRRLGPRRGLIAIFILGWLLLPTVAFRIPMMKNYGKVTAISASAVVSILAFDSGRLRELRFRWIDIPMVVWCVSPMASSLANDLGVWDGLSAIADQLFFWGIPYIVGRIYFTDAASLRDLAIGIVLGGILYLPLCLYEIKMSPQLNRMVYGYSAVDFIEARRYGGWRPTVFMQHGLAVSLFMGSAGVAAFWMWRRRAVTRLRGIHIGWIAVALLVVATLCRSGGALMLTACGILALVLGRAARTRIPLLLLLAVAPAYMISRGSGAWSGESLLETAQSVDADRGTSLETRIKSENLLAAKARRQLLFGWGGWYRAMDFDEAMNFAAVPDGFWIITFGKHGLVGLAAVTMAMLLPVLVFLRRTPIPDLHGTEYAPALSIAALVIMFMIDSLFNAMSNPVFAVAAGALGSLSVARRPAAIRRPAAGPAQRPLGRARR